MVSPAKRKGRVSPRLLEHVFINPVAEADAEAMAKAPPASKNKKLQPRNGAEWVNELKTTTREAEEKEKAAEEKEVFVVRDPEEANGKARGKGRPRGARARKRTAQSPEGPKESGADDRLPYGFPAEGEASRQISEQSDLFLHDPEEDDLPTAK